MTSDQDIDRQEALESRLAQIWAQDVSETETVETVFGPLESWFYRLGQQVLLLHPVLKEWFYLDRLHDTWERTGYGPGEVVFAADGKWLGARKRDEDPQPPAITCYRCGANVVAGNSFCGQCGAVVASSAPPAGAEKRPIICHVCRHPNKSHLLFCTQCGSRLK